MAIITNFIATETWQEITGVSSISALFLLQNRSSVATCLIYLGIIPVSEEIGFTLDPEFERMLNNIENTEKIWIKVLKNGVVKTAPITINQR